MSTWNSERTQPFHKVDKNKFVRDIMDGLNSRRLDREEAEAIAIINSDAICSNYMRNRHYPRGKKATAWQYQT